MAEFILLSIILLVWLMLGLTVFCRNSSLAHFLRIPWPDRKAPPQTGDCPPPYKADNRRFACKVQLQSESSDGNTCGAFAVMIRGAVRVPTLMHETDVQILIADVTAGADSPQPVLCAAKQWQLDDSPAFCYRACNGKIPDTDFVISDWLAVATIPTDLLQFPAKGNRKLQFVTTLISHQTSNELASASVSLDYRNDNLGYADAKENAERTQILTLQLAAAVCTGSDASRQAAAAALQRWIDDRFASDGHTQTGAQRHRKLSNALKEAIEAAKNGQGSCIDAICSEMVSIATIVDIYDAMKLCLQTVAAAGVTRRDQTRLISYIAAALGVDEKKFRDLSQKILPLTMHEEKDLEFILGITADMTPEEGKNRLRDEYQKWNARVNHSDGDVQTQADQMLTLIAEATDHLLQETASQ